MFRTLELKIMKKVLLSGLFALLTTALFAQTAAKASKGRPNIPGTFLIEVGFNQPFNEPDTFDVKFFGSRTLNLYYQHEIVIPAFGKKLSFNPGIGLGMERFTFKESKTLSYHPTTGDLQLDNAPEGTKKSQLIANYLDFPLELRFSASPTNPSRSFKFTAGFRPGVRIDSFTKVKYREDSETKKLKDKQSWNLSQIRYGIYTRMNVGNFGLFGYYNLSTYFEEKKGIQGKDINVLTFGISIAGF